VRCKLAVLFGLFVLPVSAWADTYYISASSGAGADCTAAAPCDSFATAAGKVASRPATIHYFRGHYTATGNANADIIVGETTFPRFDGVNWITIEGDIIGTGLFSSTEAAILSGYATNTIKRSSGVEVRDLYFENHEDQAFEVLDSSAIYIHRLGLKSPNSWSNNFGNGIVFASANDGAGLNRGTVQSLIEDVWITGVFKYGVLIGGTTCFSEKNIVRRVVMRWDGSAPTNNPTGGIVNYGVTTDINGARNNIVQNSIVLDNNPCVAPYYGGGETCYSGFYIPHAATNIQTYGSVALNLGTDWEGFGFGEDSASNNQVYNSIAWNIRTNPVHSSNLASSQTLANMTIYSGTAPFFNDDTALAIRNTQWYRSQAPVAGSSSTHNGYFPSTAAPAGGLVRYMDDPYVSATIYITSPSVVMSTRGISGTHLGARIMYQHGQTGTRYGDAGYNVLSSTPLFNPDFPYGVRIKSLFSAPDTGGAKANNPSNDVTRGWTDTDLTLAAYVATYAAADKTCPSDICIGAAEGGGGDPSPTPGITYGINGGGTFRPGGTFR